MKENLDYKVKIDMPNITELISETFDGVLDYMFPGMLVFGGALRDIIAGFGLHHDLDIAASHSEGKKFIQYLETSSKWVEKCVIDQYKEQVKIVKDKTSDITSPHSMEGGMLDLNRNLPCITKPKFSNYGNVQSVRTFINPSGRKLQVIIGKSNLFILKEHPPILIVKNVDFICCGIMMDIDGNVYEIVEGAKNDCIKKILRINKNANIELHNLNERIKKLTNRGWKSEINLAQIRHKQARLKRIEKKKIDETGIYEHILSNGIMQIIINTSKMQIFKRCNNSNTKTLELLYRIFRDYNLTKTVRNCGVGASYNNHNHIIISITSKNAETITNLKQALLYQEHKLLPHQKYRVLPSQEYGQEYKIDLPRLKKKKGDYLPGAIIELVDRSPKAYPHKNEFAPKVYDYPALTWGTAACSTGITTSSTYTSGGETEWTSIEDNKVRKPNLEMFEEKKLMEKELVEFGKEKSTGKHNHTILESKKTFNVGPINKTELIENRSNLKITKEEKMGVEYEAYSTGGQAQRKRMEIEMNKISKHFTGKQVESLNTEEKGVLVKYLASKL